MEIYEFRLKFHWSLFPIAQLTIFQHWFRKWLGADQATSHYLNQWWLVYWRILSVTRTQYDKGGCARQKQASSATKFSIKPAYEMWIEVVSRPLQAKIESNHGNSWPRELAGDNVLEIDWNICVNIGSSNGFATNRRQTTICANFHHDAWRHMAFLCLNMLIPTYANNTSLSVGVYRW